MDMNTYLKLSVLVSIVCGVYIILLLFCSNVFNFNPLTIETFPIHMMLIAFSVAVVAICYDMFDTSDGESDLDSRIRMRLEELNRGMRDMDNLTEPVYPSNISISSIPISGTIYDSREAIYYPNSGVYNQDNIIKEEDEMEEEEQDEVFKNQVGLINVTMYDYLHLAIIGCGSIGSYLSFGLNKLGFNRQLLIDNDVVEKHNIPTQVYDRQAIGTQKVRYLKYYLDMQNNNKGNIGDFNEIVGNNDIIQADVIFVCVDSIEHRKNILRSAIISANSKMSKKPKLLIDGRMHGLVYRVFTVNLEDAQDIKAYMKTLEGDAVIGDCSQKGIIHNIFGVVSTMIEQYRKALSGERYSQEINVDIRSGTIVKTEAKTWKK